MTVWIIKFIIFTLMRLRSQCRVEVWHSHWPKWTPGGLDVLIDEHKNVIELKKSSNKQKQNEPDRKEVKSCS